MSPFRAKDLDVLTGFVPFYWNFAKKYDVPWSEKRLLGGAYIGYRINNGQFGDGRRAYLGKKGSFRDGGEFVIDAAKEYDGTYDGLARCEEAINYHLEHGYDCYSPEKTGNVAIVCLAGEFADILVATCSPFTFSWSLRTPFECGVAILLSRMYCDAVFWGSATNTVSEWGAWRHPVPMGAGVAAEYWRNAPECIAWRESEAGAVPIKFGATLFPIEE